MLNKSKKAAAPPISPVRHDDKDKRALDEAQRKKDEAHRKKMEIEFNNKVSLQKKQIGDDYNKKDLENAKYAVKLVKSGTQIDNKKKELDDKFQVKRKKAIDAVRYDQQTKISEKDDAENERRRLEIYLEKVLDQRDQHDAEAAEELRELKIELERIKGQHKEIEKEAARGKKILIMEAEKEIEEIRRKIALAEKERQELENEPVINDAISEDEIDY